MTTADHVFQALVLAACPVALAFAVIYGTTAPWWRSNLGLGLFIKAVGVAIILTYSALFYLLGPDYTGRDVIRIVGMSLVLGGLIYNTANLARAQLRGRRRE